MTNSPKAYLVILDDITPNRATVTAVRPYADERRALDAGHGNYDVVTDPNLVPTVGERVWIESTGRSSGRRPITRRA